MCVYVLCVCIYVYFVCALCVCVCVVQLYAPILESVANSVYYNYIFLRLAVFLSPSNGVGFVDTTVYNYTQKSVFFSGG